MLPYTPPRTRGHVTFGPPEQERCCDSTSALHDRYPTASALGEDLQRYLDDEPISARRPSLLGNLRRWGRKNRTTARWVARHRNW